MTLLRILIFVAIFGLSQQCLRMQAGCPRGSLPVKKQKTCVELVNEKLTYEEAEGTCIAKGGQVLNAWGSVFMDDVRKVLAPQTKKLKLKNAWVGVVADTERGKELSVNGTNVTFNYFYYPDVYWFHGADLTEVNMRAAECFGDGDPATCPGLLKLYGCYVNPLRKLSPAPGTDYRVFQQYLRELYFISGTLKDDPPCRQMWRKRFGLDKPQPFDLENPEILLTMDLTQGYMDSRSDTLLAWHKELLPVVCEYPLG